MFGISVYAGMENNIEEIIEYMNRAYSLGLNTIFTSAHIPETNESFKKDFEKILEHASKLGFLTMVDISKNYFDSLDIKKYNIDYLRLDYGFTLEEIAQMTQNYSFGITVNATTFVKQDIEKFISYGGRIDKINACHNFYPRKDTGISEDLLIEKNSIFRQYGIKTMAFIPSQYKRRGPVYEGLPTLEMHRNVKPLVSAQHLQRLGVDFIVIGDAMASEDEMKSLNCIKDDETVIPIRFSKDLSKTELEILNSTHTNRMDPGEFVVRSQESRLIKSGKIIPNNNILPRKKYFVTIDNEKYKRYEGELQILKKDFDIDDRVNVVGDASEGNILIEMLKPGEKFSFYMVED